MPLWASFALLGAGLFAVILEVFVPAAGLIGIAGGIAIIAAVVSAFTGYGAGYGLIVLALALVLVPTVFMGVLRIFPMTFVGKKLILKTVLENLPHTGGQNVSDRQDPARTTADEAYHGYLGLTGTALTDLRPSGTARIGRERLSVVTSGEFLEKGTEVIVTKHEGSRVVVQKGSQ
jgi:membrane-bound serine protease (ClpP class)